jgi:hypothetical protein
MSKKFGGERERERESSFLLCESSSHPIIKKAQSVRESRLVSVFVFVCARVRVVCMM